jgi:hypothetical protein
LDHQVGLAIENLRFVPLGPPKLLKLPEYLDDLSQVDNHRHERKGGNLCGALDLATARRSLINLLRANSGGFNGQIQEMMLSALEAQDYDEREYNRKVTLPVLKLQLEVLCMIEYRVGLGHKKYNALNDVANTLGKRPETVRGWEKNLRAEFRQVDVTRELSTAKNLGTHERKCRANDGIRDRRYGEASLQRLAQQYNETERRQAEG